ncbi:hypothetical protein BD310DRAFT_925117 [Dichomitus squalens]|uniref:Uncharacterized protein n=1 Tax=Dichomitus squalens TaxID=114155 RepID=A0A4Q9PXU8_9APHY|nr:hypothetical protein BD310DRAFT_925117 [Dichomitus squalens]
MFAMPYLPCEYVISLVDSCRMPWFRRVGALREGARKPMAHCRRLILSHYRRSNT